MSGRSEISADLPLSRTDKSERLWKKIWLYHGSPSPPPPSPISYQWRMKNIHQEERKALLHDIEVYCKYIHSSEKKNTQLASKRPISQGWDWPFKKADKKEPATKMVEKNNCHCWRWKPLLGGPGTGSPKEILKIFAPNEANWGYSTSFHKFFFHLLKSKNYLRLWLDKDIRNVELLTIRWFL